MLNPELYGYQANTVTLNYIPNIKVKILEIQQVIPSEFQVNTACRNTGSSVSQSPDSGKKLNLPQDKIYRDTRVAYAEDLGCEHDLMHIKDPQICGGFYSSQWSKLQVCEGNWSSLKVRPTGIETSVPPQKVVAKQAGSST